MNNAYHDNVSEAELDKFARIAHRWWDPNSEFKPLHDINPLRLGYIEERTPVGGLKVIDVGCGGGILSEAMALRGATVTGIDMGDVALEVAKLHSLESGVQVEYLHTSAEQIASERAGQYDVVTCLEMLEHVPDPASVIRACADLCKPGGMLYFSTINRNPKAWLFAIVGAEYLLRMLPPGTHDFAQFIRPSELSRWLRDAELELLDVTGMSYNPLTKRYWLGRDIDVNYLACARKPG